MKLKKTLTNIDIINICKHLNIKLNGIFMKDELQPILKQGNYIMNLQNHNQNGSHWTCFIKHKKTIYYFDAFGMPPPQNEIDLFHQEHDKVLYNEEQIQDIHSDLCGWYCIAFLLFCKLNPNSSFLNKFKFVDMFDLKNSERNDKLLTVYINKYLK